MATDRCPNCGNNDESTIHGNGASEHSLDLTLLCVARVQPTDRSWTHVEPEADQIDESGKVECGMQWSPNLDEGRDDGGAYVRDGEEGMYDDAFT